MMNFKFFLAALLLFGLLIVSCENDTLDPNILNSANNSNSQQCESCSFSGASISVCLGSNGNAVAQGVDTFIEYDTYIISLESTGAICEPISNDDSSTTNSFFARVDGAEYLDGLILVDVFTDLNPRISISALDSNNQILSIRIPTILDVGTYSFVESAAGDSSGPDGGLISNAVPYNSTGTGSMTITAKTATTIAGTFQFQAINGSTIFEITEGDFSVTY
jgi:hypothetical protein